MRSHATPAIVDGQRLLGHVRLSVDGATVTCDSAWRHVDGHFRMMGNVRVDDDPVTLTGAVLTLRPRQWIWNHDGA